MKASLTDMNHSNVVSLEQAPCDVPLLIVGIENTRVADILHNLGLYEGDEIVRLDESLEMQSVKIKGPSGEVVLGGGMGLKTIIHLEDGRRLPLLDMTPGESGHVEGFTGGNALVHALGILGIREGDTITMLRRLPPMDYITRIKGQGLKRLTDGDAAKLWGKTDNRYFQFCMASTGDEFTVDRVLGGRRAKQRILALGIDQGSVLILDRVEPASRIGLAKGGQIAISTPDGLHLHLPHNKASRILVIRKAL